MIMDELLYGVEWMLLHQIVLSFWTCLLDMVMLWRHVPTNITSCDTLCRIYQHHITSLTNVAAPVYSAQRWLHCYNITIYADCRHPQCYQIVLITGDLIGACAIY